jgi:hypothetical protein
VGVTRETGEVVEVATSAQLGPGRSPLRWEAPTLALRRAVAFPLAPAQIHASERCTCPGPVSESQLSVLLPPADSPQVPPTSRVVSRWHGTGHDMITTLLQVSFIEGAVDVILDWAKFVNRNSNRNLSIQIPDEIQD